MSAAIPDADYSPYDFIITLTCVFGTIFFVGPLLVPRGPDRATIRIGIMLSSFYMWLAWVTVYTSQIHPSSGLSFKRATIAWLCYSWGNVKGVVPFSLPTTTTTTTTTTHRPTTIAATTTTPAITVPYDLLHRPPRIRSKAQTSNTGATPSGTTSSGLNPDATPSEATSDALAILRNLATTVSTTTTSTDTELTTTTVTPFMNFLLAKARYTFYRATGEPISFSVLAELDDYREFYVLLSPTNVRSVPRIKIHIGANDGRECTVSKNGIIVVRENCKPDWRKNVYLPFFIWHHDGRIVAKSGYEGAEHSARLVHWVDPEPFAVHYYGIRSSGADEIPVLVKNVEDEEDWDLD